LNLGWRASFVIVAAATLLWLPLWLWLYSRPEKSSKVSPGELALINSDAPDTVAKVPWLRVFLTKETWAYALGKFLIDPIWWMYLFWLPDFFQRTYGLDLKTFGPPIVAIYLLSDVGSIAGGWLSSTLLKAGLGV